MQLLLTNNWNPIPNVTAISARDDTTNNSRPRNTLGNDYGQQFINYPAFKLKGTVQEEWVPTSQLSLTWLHDEFYTSPTTLNAFLNYTTQIVTRYPAVLGW